MTIQQKLQAGRSEILRKVSDKTLETEKVIITAGGAGGMSAPRACVQVLNKGTGKCYGFVRRSDETWTLLLNGVEIKKVNGKELNRAKLTESIMEQKSLGEFAPSWFGDLLSRAVWGLCYAQTTGQRLDGKYDLVKEGMAHAGLPVSADGKVCKAPVLPVRKKVDNIALATSPSRRPRTL